MPPTPAGDRNDRLLDFADLLGRLSDSMMKRESFATYERLYQNTKDSAGYLSPELDVLSKFVIPISPNSAKYGSLALQREPLNLS
ncbi:unnamed protein product [Oikopleura dioica]|uniref:Uncharacterized protein n=1 Tax=Oikopleura dioica TaxID=34765 RepID=E4XH91_OIKDI|nr:unnamed protein product [Oikopleura dioica]